MTTPRSGWVPFDLSCHMDISADIANGDVVICCAPLPFAGTVKEIWAVADILPTSGTLTVQKAVGTVDASLLAATLTINTGLTANVAAKLTLATTPVDLRVAATNMLRATWTFTTIGSGEGFGCTVWVEPDVW